MTEQEWKEYTRTENELSWEESKKASGKSVRQKRNTQSKTIKKIPKEIQRQTSDFTLASASAVVWYKPSSTGVRLSGAHLTRVTPRPSYCGTAQGFRADNSSELSLAHLVIHGGKARPSTVVCQETPSFHF